MLAELRDSDLADPRHQCILRAIRALADAGTDPEPGLVLAELQRTGAHKLFPAGRDAGVVLLDLLGVAPAGGMLPHYVQLVRDQAVLTAATAVATRIRQAVDRGDVDALLVTASQSLAELLEDRDSGQPQGSPALRQEVGRQRLREEAARVLRRERADAAGEPAPVLLTDFLAVPDEEVAHRIEGLWPVGGRVVLAAQYKAGKTTLRDNLVRALVDDELFLGRFTVHPPQGRVVIIDNELDERMLRRWLRDQGVQHPERVAVLPLRGRVASFDLLDDDTRARWAAKLRSIDAAVVLFDCLRPVLDALGLSEDKEAGRFLVAFDALLAESEASEAVVVHHMGHAGERSRGDTRLRDWPDVEWTLVRERTDEDEQDSSARRFFAAYGRDVEQPEGLLDYDHDSRRLTLAGGTRRDAKADAGIPQVLAYLDSQPGATQRGIEVALKDLLGGPKAARAALKRAVLAGQVDVSEGPRRSHLHFLTTPSAPSAPASEPAHPAQSRDECASAPLGGARRTPHRFKVDSGRETIMTSRRTAPAIKVLAPEAAAAELVRDAVVGGAGLDFDDIPAVLDEAARAEWERLAEVYAGAETRFREGDRAALVAYCAYWSGFLAAAQDVSTNGPVAPGRSDKDRGRMVKNPATVAMRECATQLRYWARELGLTPDARGRIGVSDDPRSKPDAGNPFAWSGTPEGS